MKTNVKLKLSNVRLSFPSIFKKSNYDGKEGKYEATFLLNKETQKDQIDMLMEAIKDAMKEAKIKVGSDKICLRDGDDIEYSGYAGHMAFKASTNRRPTLIDRDKSPLVEDDDKLYAGCYVNAIVGVWAQNNNYGKRINGNLYGIQFAKDGESFVANLDVMEDFDDLSDDEMFQ